MEKKDEPSLAETDAQTKKAAKRRRDLKENIEHLETMVVEGNAKRSQKKVSVDPVKVSESIDE